MLTITPLTDRAIEIVAEGRFTSAEVGDAFNRMTAILDDMPKLDVLADVRGSPSIALSAITEELKRLPLVFRMIRQIERVAIVADAQWIRTASRIEGAVIPGVHYEVYERHEEAHAREWLLRHTDVARPPAG
ncbi:MAG: STAS/SEC14 domain-containing protein [Sphingomonas sp.]|uniref:STAS/SEC14 domain-containing protein n=1 Tax=Sphingomonas sp. TaxID=28214 RepID=UPI001B19D922|nr:STAS/SEC14 domain-containing protein [Sphingomonas sp.]MBO9623230.1 STAS/SEC14 domain-containing protein [Sphingomonas sp.]